MRVVSEDGRCCGRSKASNAIEAFFFFFFLQLGWGSLHQVQFNCSHLHVSPIQKWSLKSPSPVKTTPNWTRLQVKPSLTHRTSCGECHCAAFFPLHRSPDHADLPSRSNQIKSINRPSATAPHQRSFFSPRRAPKKAYLC